MKDLNAALELQINSLQTEQKYRSSRRSGNTGAKIFDEDDSRDGHGSPNVHLELQIAKQMIKQLEMDKEGAFDKQTNLRDFAMRVHQLENENQMLKDELRRNSVYLRANPIRTQQKRRRL